MKLLSIKRSSLQLSSVFSHTVSSDTITINAPVEEVWAILVDLPRYHEWNPFTHRVDSTLKLGHPVDLHVRLPGRGARLQREYVRAVEKPERLAWGMEMLHRHLLSACREQRLESVADGRCRYVSTDAFSGWLTPLVVALFGRSIRDGFNACGLALKQRAEAIAKRTDIETQKSASRSACALQ